MLSTNSQTNSEFLTQKTYPQYSKTALNFVLTTGTFLFLKTSGFSWFWGAGGAERPETYEVNSENNRDIQNSISVREETTLKNHPPYPTKHRSLQEIIPQSDTLIEGNIIGQLSLSTEITDFTIKDNLAYVTAGESGFHIIDVTDASNPETVGQYNTAGFAHQLQLIGNYTYIAYGPAGLRIVDVSDVTNPFLAGIYMMDGNPWKEMVIQVEVIGGVAVLINSDSTELTAINVSDPTQVFKVCYNTPGLASDVTVVGNLTYIADGSSGLQVLDIANPNNPQFLGSYDTLGWAGYLAVVGNLTYIADGSSGLQVLDITNPANPRFVGSYDTPGSVWYLTVVGNLAYVADGSSGLQILDITNPANPQFVGSYDTPGSARGITVVGNLAYVADHDAGLQILDITNPANLQFVGSYAIPTGSARGITVVGNLAYVAYSDLGLQIIDITNSANPQLVGSYYTLGVSFDVRVLSNLAYVADDFSGLQIIDISNPTNPELVSSYDTPGYAFSVVVVGNFAYVADGTSGLQIIDTARNSQYYAFVFNLHQAMTQFFSYQKHFFYMLSRVDLVSIYYEELLYKAYSMPDVARGVTLVDTFAYVADSFSGLQIVDISNPDNPQLVGSYYTPGISLDVRVVSNLAYVADGFSGLQIIDISNPSNLQLVGTYNTPDVAINVAVDGNLAYVVCDTSGLQVIDVSNPTNPQFVGSYDTSGKAQGVAVVNNLAYVADFIALRIIDISSPANPQLVGSYNTFGIANEVAVVGNLAYVADDHEGLQIIDITNPNNLQLVSSYDTPGYAFSVVVVGSFAYVADGTSGLQDIDVSNPTRPLLMRSFSTSGNVFDVDIINNTVCLASNEAGLQIIDLSVQENAFTAEGMVSYMTAFDEIAYLIDTHKNLYILNITDPNNMIAISQYQLAFHALDIEIFNGYLYVAQGADGIEIIDVRTPQLPLHVTHNITDITDVKTIEIDNNRLYVENMIGNLQVLELIINAPAAPNILSNRLIINEGDYITVTPNDLSATNTEIPDAEIDFIIEDVSNGQFEHQNERDTIINRFTQQQLIDGQIRFTSLSFESILDPTISYRVAATNGVQSAFFDADIDFNARPRLIKNYLKIKRGETLTISSQELLATDFDDNDADLLFEINNVQHGEFRWKDGDPTQQFWQENITQGLILFIHDNSDSSPSYQVNLYDKRMVVGNNTVRVTFDKTTYADNTGTIAGGVIAGVVGLGLIGFGLFAVVRTYNNDRSRKKHPFADYLARELKLPGVENFDTPKGQTYLAAIVLLNDALNEQGYDMAHMNEAEQKEWASDIAAAAKNMITTETNCCGESKITPALLQAKLQTEADNFVRRVLEYRFQGSQSPRHLIV